MKRTNNRISANANPQTALIRQSIKTVTDPNLFGKSRSVRILAWAVLKSARGQTVCQRRLQDNPTRSNPQAA